MSQISHVLSVCFRIDKKNILVNITSTGPERNDNAGRNGVGDVTSHAYFVIVGYVCHFLE